MNDKKLGTITFKRKDKSGHFYYSFKIADYHAAKILEYISQVPHEVATWRDNKGKFTTVEKLLTPDKEAQP